MTSTSPNLVPASHLRVLASAALAAWNVLILCPNTSASRLPAEQPSFRTQLPCYLHSQRSPPAPPLTQLHTNMLGGSSHANRLPSAPPGEKADPWRGGSGSPSLWGLRCPPSQGLAQRDQSLGEGQRNEISTVSMGHCSGGLAAHVLSDSIPVALWDLSQCVTSGEGNHTADPPANAQAIPSRCR